MPRPFQPADKAELALWQPRHFAGVRVEAIEGLPPGAEPLLRQALAEALVRWGVPADAGDGNRVSHSAFGWASLADAQADPLDVSFEWLLVDIDGREVATHRRSFRVAAAHWYQATPETYLAFAQEAAPWLGHAALGRPKPVELPRTQVAISVSGGGAGRDLALRRAVAAAFRQRGWEALEQAEPTAPAVEAHIAVSDEGPEQRRVRIDWVVREPGGGERGRMDQENVIARGALETAWGEIAQAVAAAAVEEILPILAP